MEYTGITQRHIQDRMAQAIQELSDVDDRAVFRFPAMEEFDIPNYLDKIKRPMDFKTLASNLKSGQYDHGNRFKEDLLLIYENCIEYNGMSSEYGCYAKRQRLLAMEVLARLSRDGILPQGTARGKRRPRDGDAEGQDVLQLKFPKPLLRFLQQEEKFFLVQSNANTAYPRSPPVYQFLKAFQDQMMQRLPDEWKGKFIHEFMASVNEQFTKITEASTLYEQERILLQSRISGHRVEKVDGLNYYGCEHLLRFIAQLPDALATWAAEFPAVALHYDFEFPSAMYNEMLTMIAESHTKWLPDYDAIKIQRKHKSHRK